MKVPLRPLSVWHTSFLVITVVLMLLAVMIPTGLLKTVRAFLTPSLVHGLKMPVALAGALVLSWMAQGRGISGSDTRRRRWREGFLVALGILSALLYWNLGKFRFDSYVHTWDAYHYYVGAKYFRELGYNRLYLCSAVADLEDQVFAPGHTRYIRDLETNVLRRVSAIAIEQTSCTQYFSADRWVSFKADVAWFRNRIGTKMWERALRDHGYNGTPVWAILGTTLAQTGSASDLHVTLLTLIDPILMLIMWGAVTWAFGWRAMCAGLIFWGTNYAANSGWTGGSYLRLDWLAACIIGLCFLRVGRPMAAGFLLTTSMLLRLFPGLIFGGLLLKAVWAMWEQRSLRPPSELRRLVIGCVAAIVVLVPLSTVVAGRASVWTEFLANTRKHWNTPLTNYMGLKTVLAYDHSTRAAVTASVPLEDDPFAIWKAARQRVFSQRWPIFVAVLLGFGVLLTRAVRHQPLWVAGVLGVGLIPMSSELTCYYYAILLAYGLLWERYPSAAIALSLLAAATWIGPSIFSLGDQVYLLLSAMVIVFVVYATLIGTRRETSTLD